MAAGRAVVDLSSPTRRIDLKTKLLTAFVVCTNVLGNFSMSWGMKHQSVDLGLSPFAYIRLIFTPWVLLGTALLILWLLSRMMLLGWADLSYVLPVTSIGYVMSAILGKVFFGEQVTWQRWLGTAFIVAGIVFVGRTAANTTQPGERVVKGAMKSVWRTHSCVPCWHSCQHRSRSHECERCTQSACATKWIRGGAESRSERNEGASMKWLMGAPSLAPKVAELGATKGQA